MIPIVYGSLTPDRIMLSNMGTIVIGDPNAIDKPDWYCNSCTEAF
jgi:hypothetical protein